MIEALFLLAVLSGVLLLLINLRRAAKPGEKNNLGFLAFLENKDDFVKKSKKVKNSA